jgi:hypothetical protein
MFHRCFRFGSAYNQEYSNCGDDDEDDEKHSQEYCPRPLKLIKDFYQSSQINNKQSSIGIYTPASELKPNMPKYEIFNTQEYVSFRFFTTRSCSYDGLVIFFKFKLQIFYFARSIHF